MKHWQRYALVLLALGIIAAGSILVHPAFPLFVLIAVAVFYGVWEVTR